MEQKQKGFTIIELLVAMAILGLLIAVMIPGIAVVRRGARNTARRTSLQAIQAAIEDYYGTARKYPTVTNNAPSGITINYTGADAEVDSQFTDTAATAACGSAISDVQFRYKYELVTGGYKLTACMEPDGESYILDGTN